MSIGQELEYIRKKCGLSIIDVCNSMNVSESEYNYMCSHSIKPNTYQLIMFISASKHPISFI